MAEPLIRAKASVGISVAATEPYGNPIAASNTWPPSIFLHSIECFFYRSIMALRYSKIGDIRKAPAFSRILHFFPNEYKYLNISLDT